MSITSAGSVGIGTDNPICSKRLLQSNLVIADFAISGNNNKSAILTLWWFNAEYTCSLLSKIAYGHGVTTMLMITMRFYVNSEEQMYQTQMVRFIGTNDPMDIFI